MNDADRGPWHLVSRSTGRHAGPFSTELDCVFARSIAREEFTNSVAMDDSTFTAHLAALPADPELAHRVQALGEGQRGTRWRDRMGYEYEWDAELSLREGTHWWHIYYGDGELLDDLIEPALTERGVTDGPYTPVDQ